MIQQREHFAVLLQFFAQRFNKMGKVCVIHEGRLKGRLHNGQSFSKRRRPGTKMRPDGRTRAKARRKAGAEFPPEPAFESSTAARTVELLFKRLANRGRRTSEMLSANWP